MTGNSLVTLKVWAPKHWPLHLPLTTPSHSYFSRESPFTGLSCVLSLGFLVFLIFSLSSWDLEVSAPSFCPPFITQCNKECSPLVVQGRKIKCVVRGRKIKNARHWPYRAEKIKCCYQLRGSEKHVHSKEGSTGHLYKCPCA